MGQVGRRCAVEEQVTEGQLSMASEWKRIEMLAF